jgi:arginyl-tRNA synthetase
MLHSKPKTKSEHPPHVDQVGEVVAEALSISLASPLTNIIKSSLEKSGRPELGELALKTFVLSRELGRRPNDIAAEISAHCRRRVDLFHAVNIALPYINFTLNYGSLSNVLADLGGYVRAITDIRSDVVVVEHTQPNTHKELHVGHLRNTILGDSIYRMLRPYYSNAIAVDYHGDEGVHVARVIWYIKRHDLWPDEGADRGAWLGEIYPLAVAEFETLAKTPQGQIYYQEVSAILRNIEGRDGKDYALWKETREWSLLSFERIYRWLDVHFDARYSESVVSEASQRRVDEFLKKGIFINSDGAIGCDLREYDLGFCMLRKSDGSGLYATKDVELAIERYRDFRFDTCVYIVDNRQRFHFQQVFHTLKKMGFPFADFCVHLGYDIVQTREGAISSRRGARLSAQAVTRELEEVALTNINQRLSDDVATNTQRDHSAHAIALAAMRYGMLRVDPDKKITFDLDEWLNPEGNTGPYLLYAYARIASLLRRANREIGLPVSAADIRTSLSLLRDPRETTLLGRVLNLGVVLRDAATKLKPNAICNEVYEVAQLFNSFYNQVPIFGSGDAKLVVARVLLCEIVRQYFAITFERIGIEPLERV